MNTFKKIVLFIAFFSLVGKVFAQSESPQFAMPILTVGPDARAAGMGNLGVATQPTVNAQAWNSAKYVFTDSRAAISLSYVPWLRNVGSTNIDLLYLTGFFKLDSKQAIAASLRYFSLGDLTFYGINQDYIKSSHPNEMALDVSYSRLLGQYFSIGAAFRYLRSDLAGGRYATTEQPDARLKPANGVAADLGFYYEQPLRLGSMMSELSAGLSITNIGTKMAYAYDANSDKNYFLPTTFRLGGNLKMDLDYYNELAVSLEFSKYMVPTPPVRDGDEIIEGMEDNVSVIKGMFQSFYDAPGGFSEEMCEFMEAIGVEYTYSRMFSARVGYFNDPKNQHQRYFTLGAGLIYTMFSLDLSYMAPVVSGFQSPLANTVHVTFTVDFGKTQTRRSFERY